MTLSHRFLIGAGWQESLSFFIVFVFVFCCCMKDEG